MNRNLTREDDQNRCRKGAGWREWQRQRDVSSSPEANWELRLQQSPNKRELMLYVNHV